MFELWIRVTKDSQPQFVAHCIKHWLPLYEVIFIIPHQHSRLIIAGECYEAMVLGMKPMCGQLHFDDFRVIDMIKYPVFTRIDHVDPRECQALPIGPVDLMAICRRKSDKVEERSDTVLPRGEYEDIRGKGDEAI